MAPARQVRPHRRSVAAPAAPSGRATGSSKGRDGTVEAIRTLTVIKPSACRDRTATISQMRALALAAPDDNGARFTHHSTVSLVTEAAAMRPRAGELVGGQEAKVASTIAARRTSGTWRPS